MDNSTLPGLFGLVNSNRDFTRKRYWGKNQFNSSFPAALACYMGNIGIEPVYLCLDQNSEITKKVITVRELFGLAPLSPHLHFSFESIYTPYEMFVIGDLPRVDLVTLDTSPERALSLQPLEIKLTALPDDQTHDLSEDQFGCEIVVRPDTIVYLALGIISIYRNERSVLLNMIEPICSEVRDWGDPAQVRPLVGIMTEALDRALINKLEQQTPLLMQPVWKTRGKSPILHDDCLDLFVWSDFAFTRLFVSGAQNAGSFRITRFERTLFWLIKMLYDFAQYGKFAPRETIDRLTYDTRNDKAFSVGGRITHQYMKSPELTTPRIGKDAFREIIIGGGHHFLSPERRLDAVILNTPGLFLE